MKWKSHRIVVLSAVFFTFITVGILMNIDIIEVLPKSSESSAEFDTYLALGKNNSILLNPLSEPNITLDLPTNGWIQLGNTLVDVDVQCIDLDVVWYNWDGKSNQTWYSPYITFTPSGDGLHNLNIYANDTHGSFNSTTFYFLIDDTSPIIDVGIHTIDSNSSGSLVHISIHEPNIDTVLYRWDFDANATWSYPFFTTRPTGNGVHILYVYAEDVFGHSETAEFQFYTLDEEPIHESYWVQILVGSIGVIGIGTISVIFVVNRKNKKSSENRSTEKKTDMITCPACGNKNHAYGGYCIYCGKLFEGYEGIEIPEEFEYSEGINIKFCPFCRSTVKDFECTNCGKKFNKP